MTATDDFSRQSFLGLRSEETLKNLRATVVGLGGGGSHIAQELAHVGVGTINLIDPQTIDASNLNRLVGATRDDVDNSVPKVQIAKRVVNQLRPWITVEVAQKTWQEADYLVKDAHVLFGCVDGYKQREYLEMATRRFCMPYFDIGMDVTKLTDGSFAVAGQMIATRPGKPCMHCIGFLTQDRLNQEENDYGDAGINPQVVWTNGVLASLAVGALIKMVCPWSKDTAEFTWLEHDGNAQTVVPSKQPEYTPRKSVCPHHGGPDGIGDPFFRLSELRSAHTSASTLSGRRSRSFRLEE